MMGDFTMRFDREILQSQIAQKEAEERAKQAMQAERDRLTQIIDEVAALLEKRARFLAERFDNARRRETEAKGFCFDFEPTDRRSGAVFSMHVRPNDSKLAVFVESRVELSGDRTQHDYVTIPVTQPNIDRARRFIETKLFEFARDYVSA